MRAWDKIHKSSEDAAVTVGNNIYFPKGAYTGETDKDLAWLAHELFHVDQYHRGELTLLKYGEEAIKHGWETGNKYEDPANIFQDIIYILLVRGPTTQRERELGP